MPVVMEPKMPTGTEVASYQTYAQARAAVDFLSDSGFDVSSITIVGTDLHMVERVTGRLTIARASLSGASSGALWGALMGMFMSAGQNAGGTGLWVGGGIVIGFEVADQEAAWKVVDGVALFSRTANLGDVRSTITHPWTTTHGRMQPEEKLAANIRPGLIRLSVGLEHIDDLIDDLQQALNK